MRLRRSRKIWRVHERHDFEATSQFQAAEREQTEPTKPPRCAEPGFYRRYSAREIRSSRYKKGSRPASAHAQCQQHGQLRALPSRRVPVLKKDGSASLITGNTMGSPEMARFVGLMRLCEARGRFSKRISCCISLPGLAESSYPSQGCALTGRPCTQKRIQLGRQKPAVQQWSQRQSRPELVDIQPTPGPECLFGAIGKETYSAPLAIARALFRLFQSSAVERSHYFGVQPNPSSVKKQVKFAVFSNQEFRCSPAEPDVCTAPRRARPRS